MTLTYNEIQKKISELPDDVQTAIASVETTQIIAEIREAHSLHIDQTGALSEEIGSLMLGLTHPQEFVKRLETGMKVSNEEARKIAQEVNERIFKPIRASLMGIHDMKTPDESAGEADDEDLPVKGVAEAKLSGTFHVPKPKNPYGGNDPYREPA